MGYKEMLKKYAKITRRIMDKLNTKATDDEYLSRLFGYQDALVDIGVITREESSKIINEVFSEEV